MSSILMLASLVLCQGGAEGKEDAAGFGPDLTVGPWSLWTDRSNVTTLLMDGERLWCGTRGGLILYDFSTGQVKRWTVLHDLPSNHVTALAVSKNGDIWIGTQEGLVRKSKASWERFTVRQGMVNDNVRGISIGPDGKIWCASAEYGGGLSVFDAGAWRAFPMGGKERVAVTPSNWVVTNDFNFLNGVALNARAPDPKNRGVVDFRKCGVTIEAADGGAEWVRFGSTLCREEEGAWSFLRVLGIPSRADSGATIYDSKTARILEWGSEGWSPLVSIPESVKAFDSDRPARGALERDGRSLFLGGSGGLWQIRPDGVVELTLAADARIAGVSSLSETVDGSIMLRAYNTHFIVTGEAPRIQLLKEIQRSIGDLTFPYIDIREEKRCDWVDGKLVEREVLFEGGFPGRGRVAGFLGRDAAGKEWYWNAYGLAYLEGRKFEIIEPERKWGISRAFLGSRGIILVTGGGFLRVDPETEEIKRIAGPQGRVSSARVTGDSIWFGTSWNGLSRYSFEDGKVKRWAVPGAREDKHNNMVRDIAVRKGKLFLATNGGVFEFNLENESWTRWTTEFANAVLVDRKQNLWIGTRSGLLHYDFEPADAGSPEAAASMEKLIKKLGHESFQEREEAMKELTAIGPAARKFLLKAGSSPSVEVQMRVKSILKNLKKAGTTVLEGDCRIFRAPPLGRKLPR